MTISVIFEQKSPVAKFKNYMLVWLSGSEVNNLAFRGNCITLYMPHKGNLLGLIEHCAKFDPFLEDYITCASVASWIKKRSNHYVLYSIQGELISAPWKIK